MFLDTGRAALAYEDAASAFDSRKFTKPHIPLADRYRACAGVRDGHPTQPRVTRLRAGSAPSIT
jgi:hypothetical protein